MLIQSHIMSPLSFVTTPVGLARRTSLRAPVQPTRRPPCRTPPIAATRPPSDGRPSDGRPSDDRPADDRPSDSGSHFARFREFTATTGNAAVQNHLVRDVMWQATRTVTTQNMESTIQQQIDAVSDLLSDMYSRSERDIVQRNEELARQTSLPNISKWNQQLIQRHKASKIRRTQISKELELVDALLRRATRKRKAKKRRTNTLSNNTVAVLSDSDPVLAVHPVPSRLSLLQHVLSIKGPKALLFTIAVCVLALESFENIASHENGPSHLANYAAITSLFLLSCTYLHTLHSAYRKANRNLEHTGAFVSKGRDD